MKKFVMALSSVLEFVFYTFLMVLIGNINIMNPILDFIIHILSLIVVAFSFYFIIRFLFRKLNMQAKKYIYYVAIWNIILGVLVPILLIIIIPSEFLTNLAFLVMISTICYGIFINIIFCFLNYFLTNRRKKS